MAALLLCVIYLCFVSLGLPDSLLGAAWPSINETLKLDASFVSYIALVITLFTTLSTLITPKILLKLHTKYIVIISICLTIVGLIGFSFANEVYMFFIFALPYGLGAGAIDAAINSYVAKHYSSRVMNFLHCFYGAGAIISPNIMALAITYTHWNDGFLWTSFIQIGILVCAIASIPLWKINKNKNEIIETKNNVTFKSAIKTPGVICTILAFFCYCSAEGITFLYTSSFFNITQSSLSKEIVASFGSLIFIGLMVGRIISGIVSTKVNDMYLIRCGIALCIFGSILIGLSFFHYIIGVVGFVLLGIGMGPIYPSIQHLAPLNFGIEKTDTIIALQMTGAYLGFTFFPLLFGLLSEILTMWLLPILVGLLLIMTLILMEVTTYKVKNKLSLRS